MEKIQNFPLASLLVLFLAFPVHAQFGGSLRGDVGMLGNQVPYFIIQRGIPGTTPVETITDLSSRQEGQWDFTARLFAYASRAPCASYFAVSWQGSNHRVNSAHDALEHFTAGIQAILPLRIIDPSDSNIVNDIISDIREGSPVLSKIDVKNKFSKTKLGMGIDLIKNSCFSLTIEMGGNYLDTQLDIYKNISLSQTNAGCITVPPDNQLCAPILSSDLFYFVINDGSVQQTQGVGLYTSFKAAYKLPTTCLGNCFSIYGKAEIADIIGRQKYSDRICYENTVIDGEIVDSPEVFVYQEQLDNRYSNVVEMDLEVAFVYSPYFRCWDNLNLNFVFGARADSFVNLFAKPVGYNNTTYLSLTRPTVFFEIGIKV